MKIYYAHAYSPRETAISQGKYHFLIDEEINFGKLHRKPGDALCKPCNKFWGLEKMFENIPESIPQDYVSWIDKVTCPKCKEILNRLLTSTL